jgi:hypothetical protein
MSVHFIAAVPLLTVRNVGPTRSFFCDRLGFAAVTEIVHDGVLASVRLERDGAAIVVESEARRRERFGVAEGQAPLATIVTIDVDDVLALVAEIADADIIVPLRRGADGGREIGVREPGGNVIIFASPSGA